MELLKETLKAINSPNEKAKKIAKERLDSLAKPIGSLGKLEEIVIKMAGITGKAHNKIEKRNIVVMCADNGVVEEGVSACPQEFTMILTENMIKGLTGVSVLSKMTNTDLTVVDIGLNGDIDYPGILKRKINYGTKNFTREPSMTYEEAIKAIETGIEIGDNLYSKGYKILGTGELGIGNTTTSAAILSAFTGLGPEITSGKGAGLTEEQYNLKKEAIRKGIEINKPDKKDPIDVIAKVGGFDIAGMCGLFLSAAKNKKPIVMDGFISSAAALCAIRLNPLVKEYIFPSHLSKEPGAICMMKEIGLSPMLNLEMRLGEGSGCPLAFQIIDAALYIMDNMATFEEASIDSKVLIDIREEKNR
ncbi:nicotinate-nucleotide-dimethylbenzimidazole phosphoribosyltransferase [Keratinibaculum paraultunense]|uniref:Nicotinate-nucleotide--dimethylbenzimidazole phosphoribosyltransferase n=1 Tax=Keratinibaculum paraultunense TaxID=1278232 RepID=A0A4R3KUB7_9FIRM|nr:nicotinate-nucleotide--dimethylbenzimidazole phosphoribosyltransferase [Keratinibaculum paraultunense]QQY79817.1 nicotinate-nucleotide--dimethylbenzimidazole phosphoribosyltransferase [Keratinibaculum paraultunense]TCS88698.1 nicotinate-nucleotide-dimethylbenzimidazole phosphoribosyltransferase [Keratinibaculum paraultunense]